MSIALFGTSADPPTEGHRALLEGLLRHYPRVATWASDNPMKQHGQSLAVRTQLLGALVAAIADPRLSLEPQLSSPWAIDTLRRAAARWPGEALLFVVGSDLLAQIPRWRQAEAVLAACRLAVAPRDGWPLQAEDLARLQALGAELEILDLQVPGTASSHVRSGGAAGAASGVLAEVPPALRPLLLQHNLYGLSSQRQVQEPSAGRALASPSAPCSATTPAMPPATAGAAATPSAPSSAPAEGSAFLPTANSAARPAPAEAKPQGAAMSSADHPPLPDRP